MRRRGSSGRYRGSGRGRGGSGHRRHGGRGGHRRRGGASRTLDSAAARARALADRLKPAYPPLDEKHATPAEVTESAALLGHMDRHWALDTDAGRAQREVALGMIRRVVDEWVTRTYTGLGLSQEFADTARAQLFISGSYRLGVSREGADIDCIVACPRRVTRDHFFGAPPCAPGAGLVDALNAHPKVERVVPIAGAKVPIVQMFCNGVDIDLLFASIPRDEVPRTAEELLDDNVLIGLDEGAQMSLNGPRVTEMLVRFALNIGIYDSFRLLLRCVRRWAKVRGIYSNKTGYLGGVNWAILCIWICQLHPNARPARLLKVFFQLLSVWQWPNPGALGRAMYGKRGREVRLCTPYHNDRLSKPQWPSGPWARNELLPIITPAYPCMNSSSSVTESTRQVMLAEFERGARIVKGILEGAKRRAEAQAEYEARVAAGDVPDGPAPAATDTAADADARWGELFVPTDFFARYKTYLCVTATSTSRKDMDSWDGLVGSRIVRLVKHFENPRVAELPLADICPYPKGIEMPPVPLPADGAGNNAAAAGAGTDGGRNTANGTASDGAPAATAALSFKYYIGMRVDHEEAKSKSLNLDPAVKLFLDQPLNARGGGGGVNVWKDRQPGMTCAVDLCKWKQLPGEVFEKYEGGRAAAKRHWKQVMKEQKAARRALEAPSALASPTAAMQAAAAPPPTAAAAVSTFPTAAAAAAAATTTAAVAQQAESQKRAAPNPAGGGVGGAKRPRVAGWSAPTELVQQGMKFGTRKR